MSSDLNYSSFIFDNEEFFLLPGSRFSKLELKTRLKEMNINDNNTEDRDYLKYLYDSAIQDYKNRVKIIRRLRRDTETIHSRLNLSERRSIPYNLDTSNNLPQNKIANISYDANNFHPKMGDKQKNRRKPSNDNMEYTPNSFIPNMKGQNIYKEYENKYGYDNNINLNDKQNRNNNVHKVILKKNKHENDSYDINNYPNNNESGDDFNKNPSYVNNNYRNKNYNNNYEELNSDKNNNVNFNLHQQNPYKEKADIEDNNNRYIFKKKPNNNIHIIPESKYENNIDEYDNNNNYIINETNQPNYEKIDDIPKKSQYKKYTNNPPSHERNNFKNNNYPISKNKQMNNNDVSKTKNSFINALYEGIEVKNKINNINNKNDNEEKNDDYSDNDSKNIKVDEDIKAKKDEDEKSFFSFFSAFENLKKSPLYKYRKFILIHLMVLLSFLIISISFLHLIYNNLETITNFISDIFKIFTEPRRIFDLIISFLSFVFLGPIHYWYISIPLLVLGFVFYIFMRKYMFKKRCKEIIEKIVKYLENGENNNISEEDIYKKFVQIYGINYNKFLKKYLPQLNKIRRNDNRLKQSSMKINEKIYVFWELTK